MTKFLSEGPDNKSTRLSIKSGEEQGGLLREEVGNTIARLIGLVQQVGVGFQKNHAGGVLTTNDQIEREKIMKQVIELLNHVRNIAGYYSLGIQHGQGSQNKPS